MNNHPKAKLSTIGLNESGKDRIAFMLETETGHVILTRNDLKELAFQVISCMGNVTTEDCFSGVR